MEPKKKLENIFFCIAFNLLPQFKLICNDINMNITDTWKRTSLHMAAAANQLQIAQYLLNCGADYQCLDEDGWTPIDWAVHNKQKQMVYLFQKKLGAEFKKVNKKIVKDKKYYNSMDIFDACERGQLELVKKFNKNPNLILGQKKRTPIFWAGINGHFNIIKQFGFQSPPDVYGYTPLNYIAQNQNNHCFQLIRMQAKIWSLVEIGDLVGLRRVIKPQNVNSVDAWKRSCLHIAASCGNVRVIKFLIEMGANKSQKDDQNWTAKKWAQQNHQQHVYQYFADQKQQNIENKVAIQNIFDAAEMGEIDLMNVFLNKNPNLINAKGAWNRNPLHYAAIIGNKQCYESLTKRNAKIQRDLFKLTPMDYICRNENNKLRKFILQ